MHEIKPSDYQGDQLQCKANIKILSANFVQQVCLSVKFRDLVQSVHSWTVHVTLCCTYGPCGLMRTSLGFAWAPGSQAPQVAQQFVTYTPSKRRSCLC